PGEKISLKDERGNIISTQTFTEETPEVNKGFFVLMYEHVASSIPLVILITGGLASIYFATRFKSNLMKLGLMGLSAVCWLLVASYFSVGAVKIPALISRML
ncbi:MAG: hypothetical protein GOV00_00120, partial [Candidatus Altiarchaeota archaeon]|nr:hypothetical protein [Candidatus Altiarchaeota archaeon]